MHRAPVSAGDDDFGCWVTRQTPSRLRTARLVRASPADGAKSPSCKPASWEKEKNEAAGRGNGATGAQYAHSVHAARGKKKKRVQASALILWACARISQKAAHKKTKRWCSLQQARAEQCESCQQFSGSCSDRLPPLVGSLSADNRALNASL